jgi:FMN-dependent NADH-azoreductase
MNTFLNQLKNDTNYGYTENGAVKRITTGVKILDLFAQGGAYRNR